MPRRFAFTVDVETDWGGGATRGVDEALPRLLELLDASRATATFFVVGELAERFRRHVAPDSRHEVGSHGHTHRRLPTLTVAQVDRELADSKRALEQCGYSVDGFRAPFLQRTHDLLSRLRAHGYRYDSSGGSVVPSVRNLRWRQRVAHQSAAVATLPPGTMRDAVTPFSLTWLRLYHPFGLHLQPRRPSVFYCHLHELVDGDGGGWPSMPAALRRLHRRRTGAPAWALLESLLAAPREWGACRDLLEVCA